jgi:hypothetical protein
LSIQGLAALRAAGRRLAAGSGAADTGRVTPTLDDRAGGANRLPDAGYGPGVDNAWRRPPSVAVIVEILLLRRDLTWMAVCPGCGFPGAVATGLPIMDMRQAMKREHVPIKIEACAQGRGRILVGCKRLC